MRKDLVLFLGVTLSVALTGTARAELVIDLDTDTNGTPVTFSFMQATSDSLLSVSWDLDFEAFTPSWGSELRINLLHVDSATSISLGGGDDASVDINFGFANASGLYSSAGTAAAIVLGISIADTSGEWLVTVDESFDDTSIMPDGHVIGTITINKVPAPGALALLGVAGLLGQRRRRR